VTDRELRRRLLSIHAPDELEAQRRAWNVVRAGFEEREPVSHRRSFARPLLAFAAALVVAAAASALLLSPVGEALRNAIGREKHVPVYRPALFSLPASGHLLVNSAHGPWIVSPDGSKRLLGPYQDASWSPHGLYVAAVGTHEVVALDPKGNVRWTLARSGRIASPRWSPAHAGSTRIAYLRNDTLRVVAGDKTGDRLVGPAARVAPTWRPGPSFVVAYIDPAGRIRVVDADSGKLVWRSAPLPPVVQLVWSTDGQRLLALSSRSFTFFGRNGLRTAAVTLPGRAVTAAFDPQSTRLAIVLHLPGGRSTVLLSGARNRAIFSADGDVTDAAWAPAGRWLLLGWRSADAWVFVSSNGKQRVVSGISRQFGSGAHPGSAFPGVPQQAWCCEGG
jgi:hypothetical protein